MATLSVSRVISLCLCVCVVHIIDGSAASRSLRHLYTTADRSAGGGVSFDSASAMITSPHRASSSSSSSSSHRQHRSQQPAFVETDFTVPIAGLASHAAYHPHVGTATDYYVMASRDPAAARPAHTGSSPAYRRLAGYGAPSIPRTTSRPLMGSQGHAYQQRRDVLPSAAVGSPLSPQATTAFLLLPASAARSQSSRQTAANVPGTARMLHSPPGSLHHYRNIQPKPSPSSFRYMAAAGPGPMPPLQPAAEVLVQTSRVTSDRRTSCPGGFPIGWRGDSAAPVLNVPRVPAAAHGSRPLLAAHASSGGPLRGAVGGRGSSQSAGVDAALSLTIDDQAPLDCSRKSSSGGGGGDSVELDVPTVLNLTTSGHGSKNVFNVFY